MASTKPDLSYIADGLRPLAVPIDRLDLLEKNPRKGDVEALAKILAEFGQREPLIARRNGDRLEIEAGNHRTLAARQLGWTHVAVLAVDDDAQRAKAFSLIHNQSHELGTYDRDALAEMVADFADDGLAELMAEMRFDIALDDPPDPRVPPTGFQPGDAPPPRDVVAQYGVIIVCGDEAEQKQVYDALAGSYDNVRVVTV